MYCTIPIRKELIIVSFDVAVDILEERYFLSRKEKPWHRFTFRFISRVEYPVSLTAVWRIRRGKEPPHNFLLN
jgi:hypothetical protein